MRKSINGLALVVADTLGLDPVSPHWFVFCNRGRDRLKILHWDTNGFWLHCRRLEEGRFHWPREGDDAPVALADRRLELAKRGGTSAHGVARDALTKIVKKSGNDVNLKRQTVW